MWGNFRLSATVIVIGGVFWVLYGFNTLLPDTALFQPDGVVVLVRNTGLPNGLGDQVLNGVKLAITERSEEEEKLRHMPFDIPPGQETPEKLEQIRKNLIDKLVKEKVLGVISDGSSLTDPVIVEVCRTLRIPLLLTSATNDSLLAETGDGYVFRLPAKNSQQATDIFKSGVSGWCKQGSFRSLAIIYETNAYGESLYDKLSALVAAKDAGCRSAYSFRVTPSTELADLVPRLNELKVDGIVFLGYFENALDLVKKLNGYGWRGRLIVSDGSYSRALSAATAGFAEARVAFPVDFENKSPGRKALEEFGAFGYDAWVLLSSLREGRGGNASEIRETLGGVTPDRLAQNGGYKFDRSGENERGHFMLLPFPGG